MRRGVARGLAAAAAGGLLLGGGGVVDAASTRTVQVRDSVYSPRTLKVRSGTKVIWNFEGSLPHNVEVTRGPELFSSSITRHGTFTRRMRARGTYRIVCTLHTNMTMKVVVR